MNIYENGEFKVATENCDSVTWGQRHVDGAPVALFYDGWVETPVVLRGINMDDFKTALNFCGYVFSPVYSEYRGGTVPTELVGVNHRRVSDIRGDYVWVGPVRIWLINSALQQLRTLRDGVWSRELEVSE